MTFPRINLSLQPKSVSSRSVMPAPCHPSRLEEPDSYEYEYESPSAVPHPEYKY